MLLIVISQMLAIISLPHTSGGQALGLQTVAKTNTEQIAKRQVASIRVGMSRELVESILHEKALGHLCLADLPSIRISYYSHVIVGFDAANCVRFVVEND